MFGWRPLREVRFASMWFRADGSILTPEGCNPQSIALVERNVEGVKISKGGGEGSPVTLHGNDGNRLTLKYEAGKWWAEGFLPLVHEVPFVPEDNPVAPQPSAPYQQPQQHDLRPYFWPLIIILIVVGLIVLTALYVLRDPLADLSHTKRTAQENKQLQLIDKAKRDALQRTVQDLHTEAATKLKGLEAEAKKFRTRFQDVVGISLDQAAAADQRPREVNLAILKDATIAQAWTDLLNASVSDADLASRQRTLDSIRQRLDTRALDYDDEQNLKKVLDWIDERQRAIDAQPDSLERLRRRLVQERAELEEERRTP